MTPLLTAGNASLKLVVAHALKPRPAASVVNGNIQAIVLLQLHHAEPAMAEPYGVDFPLFAADEGATA